MLSRKALQWTRRQISKSGWFYQQKIRDGGSVTKRLGLDLMWNLRTTAETHAQEPIHYLFVPGLMSSAIFIACY